MSELDFENIGPHDPELVELLIDKFGVTDVDRLNEVVNRINALFADELEAAWMYNDLANS